ncbi:MAG: B12-binding domain-containing radical SAM protein [Archaeoglobaceae archaeon]|nr:B12-binding domain-containing radical SAM protein [Archaeoglobaceae archaeon]MDW8117368.1 radical SAM protein [Archaeoglobaceae archaeon]
MEFNPFQRKYQKGLKKVALVYPNRYVGGVSNIGLQQIYAEINDFAICERFYTDVFDGLRSFESQTPLSEFDFALFSLQYENDYFNAVEILKKSNFKGIKIAGGPCVMENPKPLLNFFDAFFIGEVEGRVEEIISVKSPEELSGIEGIYTGKEERVKRVYSKLGKHTEKEIITEGAYGRCFLIEIGRGCVRKCTFCLVRQIYAPPRWRKLEDLPEVKDVKKVALIAPSPTDHKNFKDILQIFIEKSFDVSPSSLRADSLDEEVVELLKAGNLKSITLAPETASQELSEFLKKEISFEDVKRAVELSAGKFDNLKLYYMIGIPGENIEDVQRIVDQAKELKKFIPNVEISVNPLVPKPHTPLQWLKFGGEGGIAELRKKIKILSRECAKNGIKFSKPNLKEFVLQTILARGDENVSSILEGKSYRSSMRFLNAIERERELPWDFIDHGYRKSKLQKEFEKIIQNLPKT